MPPFAASSKMEGALTYPMIAAFMAVVTFGLSIWKISSARSDRIAKEVREAQDNLATYKLHVSETYISKEDLRSSLSPLMDNVSNVKGSVDKLADRVDRLIEDRAQPPRRSRPQT